MPNDGPQFGTVCFMVTPEIKSRKSIANLLNLSEKSLKRKEAAGTIPKGITRSGGKSPLYRVRPFEQALKAMHFQPRDGVASIGSEMAPSIYDEWMTANDVSTLLDVSRSTVLHWCRCRDIPFYRFGERLIRFNGREIRLWILRREDEGVSLFCEGSGQTRKLLDNWLYPKQNKEEK
jgi:excisionase family DNA binding protein